LRTQGQFPRRNRRSDVFVGRTRELELLSAVSRESAQGTCAVVFVEGDAGSGKSELVRHFLQGVEDRLVLLARCYEDAVVPAYWPWIQVFRGYPWATDRGIETGNSGQNASLDSVLNALTPAVEPTPVTPELAPDLARFSLYERATSLLASAAIRRSMVLAFEDLQWADDASLRLLDFVVQGLARSPVLIVGTFRRGSARRASSLRRTISELERHTPVQHTVLTGLSTDEVRAYLDAVGGGFSAEGLADRVREHTGGTPLLVAETALALLENIGPDVLQQTARPGARPEGDHPGAWDLPASRTVEEFVGRQIEGLSPGCVAQLKKAAVFGRRFDVRHVAPVEPAVGLAECWDLVAQAIEAGVVAESPQEGAVFEFVNSVTRQVLAESIQRGARARLHARFVEVIEADDRMDRAAKTAMLGAHSVAAYPLIDRERTASYCDAAGRLALKQGDHHRAISYLRRALELRGAEWRNEETGDLLFDLGVAEAAVSPHDDRGAAIATLARAFECYVECGNKSKAARVALFPLAIAGFPELTDLPARGLDLVPEGSPEAGRLASRLGLTLALVDGVQDRAIKLLGDSLTIAQRTGDRSLEQLASANLGSVLGFWYLKEVDGLQHSAVGAAATQETGDLYSQFRSVADSASCLVRLGRLDEARDHAARSFGIATRLHDRTFLAAACAVSASVAMHGGHIDEAAGFIERGLRTNPDSLELLSISLFVRTQAGDTVSARRLRARIDRLLRDRPDVAPLQLATVAAVLPEAGFSGGDEDLILTGTRAADLVPDKARRIPIIAAALGSGAAWTSLLRNDQDAAGTAYQQLLSRSGTVLPRGWAAADRLLGLLAAALEMSEAHRHFERAKDFCQKAGLRSEHANVCHDYSGFLLSRRGGLDRGLVRTLLEEGDRLAESLALVLLRPRFHALRGRLASRRGGRPEYPDGLTEREVSVLRLLAAGQSNREIAKALVISEHTAIRHVSNILAKIGVANRSEATAYGIRNGLAG
jgi:DNA-binding CsgD family transcriptional regulator/tetratricopeptide (TPR) repeat protein